MSIGIGGAKKSLNLLEDWSPYAWFKCQRCGGQVFQNYGSFECLQCSALHTEQGRLIIPRHFNGNLRQRSRK